MLFRNLVLAALLAGLLAGIALTVAQLMSATPIILAAETYELPETGEPHESDSAAHHHHHSEAAWAPENGAERTLYTLLGNVLVGIGFASVLLSLMTMVQHYRKTKLSVARGLLWGLAGYLVFFVAPGIGLPPEIPGMQAAGLEERQWWWLFAVIFSAAAVAILYLAPIKLKVLAVVPVALPYLVGAPEFNGSEFSHPSAEAVAALQQLHHQFVLSSAITNLMFWLVLGLLCGWLLTRNHSRMSAQQVV